MEKIRSVCYKVSGSILGSGAVQLLLKLFVLLILPLSFAIDITKRGNGALGLAMLVCGAAMFVLTLLRKEYPRSKEAMLIAAYSVWLLITRIFAEGQEITAMICRLGYVFFGAFVCFLMAQTLCKGKSIERFRVCAESVVALIPCVITAVSFAVLVFGCDITLGSMNLSDKVVLEWGRLKFFGTHYNTLATLFTLGVTTSIMRVFDAKKAAVKAAYAAAAVVNFCGLVITDTRTCIVITAVTIGTAAALALFDTIKNREINGKAMLAPKTAVCAVLAVLIAFGCIKITPVMAAQFMTWNHSAVEETAAEESSPNDESEIQPSAAVASEEQPSETESSEETDGFYFLSRGYEADSVLSLNGRTVLYRILIDEFVHSPRTMLLGSAKDGSGPYSCKLKDGTMFTWNHTHSSYFSTAFETGIPGLLAIAAFVVLIVIRMAKVFFAPANKLSAGERFQVLLPAGLLINSLVEPILFSAWSSRNIYLFFHILFMLWCGFIIERAIRLEKESAEDAAESQNDKAVTE